MTKTAKHLILGPRGMVGAALRREMPNAAVLPDGKDGARMPLERPSAALSRAIAKADTVWLCAARTAALRRYRTDHGRAGDARREWSCEYRAG